MRAQGRPFEGLTRDTIQDYMVARLRSGGGTRPALLLIQDRGHHAILKDYLPASWLLRALVGPWLIGREERIYRVLDGVPGVPRLIGRLDRHALVVERIDGRACSEYPDGSLPPEFFERLETVVDGIHAHGVVHCDIKNRSNIVVTDDLDPYIVDFASAFTREGRLGPLRRFAFERFRIDDQRAVVKARLLVGRIWNDADEHFAFHHGPAERTVRALRNGARWLFKALARH
ncbi:MAG TPA: hypothetical protein VNE39_12780 [Planctomycetota bacterium]|nr:hypothetical protein [Planctomycetota bacterium]